MFAYLLITWTVYPFMIVCLPPASTLSMNSVCESALPSLYLTPVTDLSCDSIKLHVDLMPLPPHYKHIDYYSHPNQFF